MASVGNNKQVDEWMMKVNGDDDRTDRHLQRTKGGSPFPFVFLKKNFFQYRGRSIDHMVWELYTWVQLLNLVE